MYPKWRLEETLHVSLFRQGDTFTLIEIAEATLQEVHLPGRANLQVEAMSLFWIHCNHCFEQPYSRECKYYVTNCGHLYCRKCAADVNKSKSCRVCGTGNVRFSQIGPKMNEEIKIGFRDHSEKLHQLFRLLEFQTMMYIDLVKRLKEQRNEAIKFVKSERDRAERYKRDCDELKTALLRAEAATVDAHQRQPRTPLPPIIEGDNIDRMLNPNRRLAQGPEFRTPLGIKNKNGSYTYAGSVTSLPVSRTDSFHSLPTAENFAGLETNVFAPVTPAALRSSVGQQPKPLNKRAHSTPKNNYVQSKVAGWLTSL